MRWVLVIALQRLKRASVNAHGGVDVEDEKRPLDDHGVDLEIVECDGVAGGQVDCGWAGSSLP